MTVAAMPTSALAASRRGRLWPTVLASLVVHAALLGLVAWRKAPAVLDLNQKPIVAKLVRLGEVRPKQYLPRKDVEPPPGPVSAAPPAPVPPAPAAAPPPKPAPPPPKVAEARPPPNAMAPPKAQPKAQPASGARAPRADPRAAGGGGLASALSRVERDQKVYGSPEGSPFGTADEGEAGDQYLALVTRALQETYVLPSTISDQERMHLRATILLFIEPDGRVARYEFESRSGNPVFDGALERAVRTARLPPPPPEMRERYRSQGLAVLYRP